MAGVKILYGVEKALENFLHVICEDYSLNYDELYERYFLPNGEDRTQAESSELPDGVPEGHKRTNKTKKPSASNGSVATASNPNRKLCCALTTKKTPCKKFAIDGTDFCSCHSNGAKSMVTTTSNRNPTPSSDMDDDATSSIPVPKSKPKVNKSKSKGKAKSKEPMPVTREEEEDVSDDESKTKSKTKAKKSDSFPVHTHPVDTEDVHSDCELCNDVGNSMMMDDDDTKDFEITDDMKTRLQNILSKIDENSGSDTEEDAE